MYRESKFWVPVKLWVQRKRVDLAYRAYLIVLAAKEKALQAKVDSDRLTAALREEAKKELKALKSSRVGHFAFIERAAAYHIMKVRHAQPHPVATARRRTRADAFCDFLTLTALVRRVTIPSLERRCRWRRLTTGGWR